MTLALLFSSRTCIVQKQSDWVNFACTKRLFNLPAEAIINVRNARLCQVRNILFEDQTNSFFLSFGQRVYIFEESTKSFQIFIGDLYCPTSRNGKCVYISTNKMTSFYDCKRCKTCCHVLNNTFNDQKPTILLFGGDATHCFAKKASRDYEKKASPFLKKVLPQSQPSTSKFDPKKDKSSPNIE